MIHLVKAKGGYMVVVMANNSEVLSISEILKTKKNGLVNIASQHRCFSNHFEEVHYQDDTLSDAKGRPVLYKMDILTLKKRVAKGIPHKRYVVK